MGMRFDRLSEEDQEHYLTQQLTPGRILRLFCHFLTRPHDKYLVLLCCKPRSYMFFINSRIDLFIQSQSDLLRCQIELFPSDYPFLRYKSYLACHEVIKKFSEDEIRSQLWDNIKRIMGELTPATRKRVIEAVSRFTMISGIDKEQIAEALSSSEH